MTEQEWLASNDPSAMCAFVRTATTYHRTRWIGWVEARRFQVSDRKWRLIDVACLARVVETIPWPSLQEALSRIETRADCDASSNQLGWSLSRILREAGQVVLQDITHLSRWLALGPLLARSAGGLFALPLTDMDVFTLSARIRAEIAVARMPAQPDTREQEIVAESGRQAELVRDILGNPFCAEPIEPVWLCANDGAVKRLAQGIYESKRYDEMPILADALEDAGCSNQAVLHHCRDEGLHSRGCWLVDRLLGKE